MCDLICLGETVYARMKDGAVKFYKDGYTDLCGYFDYTSLNTNELDFVDRFSILVLVVEKRSQKRLSAAATDPFGCS